MLFQTCKTFVYPRNTNEDEIRELSDSIDSNTTDTLKAQKGSKDIVKTVDISGSTVMLWIYKNTVCVQRKKVVNLHRRLTRKRRNR